MMNYDELLQKAMNAKPQSAQNRDRFEIPKVSGHLEGDKTVIANIGTIALKNSLFRGLGVRANLSLDEKLVQVW
jgi:translation initiation factor 2 beta subunit (eIF-2beta)/eIF-5